MLLLNYDFFCSIFILKAVNLPYNQSTLRFETIILVSFYIVETIRINLGRRGSLSDHGNSIPLPASLKFNKFVLF